MKSVLRKEKLVAMNQIYKMKEKTTPPRWVLMVEKIVVPEVAVGVGSWSAEDKEELVWLKAFPLSFHGNHIWQALGGGALGLRWKGGTRSVDLWSIIPEVGAWVIQMVQEVQITE